MPFDFLRNESGAKRKVGTLTSEPARREIDTLGGEIRDLRARFDSERVSEQPTMLDNSRTRLIEKII